jgi:twitching motility protein PilT
VLDYRIENAKTILAKLVAQIPSDLEGLEHLLKISELLDRQPEEIHHQLRQALDCLLLTMESKDASDLDMGSSGSNGWIWYRIHGEKSPDQSLAHFTAVETNILLINILMPMQREFPTSTSPSRCCILPARAGFAPAFIWS